MLISKKSFHFVGVDSKTHASYSTLNSYVYYSLSLQIIILNFDFIRHKFETKLHCQREKCYGSNTCLAPP